MEHARWCADRYLGGWRFGETADKPRKISPDLVPYDQLADEDKQYDREAVLQIPELVRLAGQRIVRGEVNGMAAPDHVGRSDSGMWIAVTPQQSQARLPRLTFQVM